MIRKLARSQIKFIKSLRFKKYRLQEKAFVIEGTKNVKLLLQSDYEVKLVAGTAEFFALHHALLAHRNVEIFQVGKALLADLGAFQCNQAALAVAGTKPNNAITVDNHEYGLVLDDIQDPGNLGSILRIADWYGISHVICSINTVERYNPKVLHASMGSFTHVNVYYVDLLSYLSKTILPIIGTFMVGENIHHTAPCSGGLVVIGNETRGISEEIMPYIQQKVKIPKYGHAESLNAAMATAVVCDNLRRRSHLAVRRNRD